MLWLDCSTLYSLVRLVGRQSSRPFEDRYHFLESELEKPVDIDGSLLSEGRTTKSVWTNAFSVELKGRIKLDRDGTETCMLIFHC